MDPPDLVTDFPITLANWHSTSSSGVPVTTLRSKTLCEHDYLDCGGSGIYVHRPDSTIFKIYQLKCDAMGSSPYYPKCFTLPLFTSRYSNNNKVIEQICSDRTHSNGLSHSQREDCFFSTHPITNRLSLYRFERNEESPALSNLFLVSSCQLPGKIGGPICEVSPAHYDLNASEAYFVRQPKLISLLTLEEGDEEVTLSHVPFTIELEEENREFWRLSKSHLLKQSLALGRYNEDGCFILSDYNMETNKFVWICSSSQTHFRSPLSWEFPVSLFWIPDHPKLLAYCELNHFALLDTRSNKTILSIMDRKHLELARDWEKFRDCCPLSISDTQFLIALDHKVILVDRRYPQKNLLSWNHMLLTNLNNLPHFLSSTTISDDSRQSVITLSNHTQATLMTVSPFEVVNIIQPKSLHMPLRLSQPSDCWKFSSNYNDDTRNRLEKSILTGLIVLPSANGYAVIQSTNGNDLFVQDFYQAEKVEPDLRCNWNHTCVQENLHLPEGIDSLLESAFSNLSYEDRSTEKSPNQVTKTETLSKPTPTIRPKFLLPLPESPEEEESSSDGEPGEQLTDFVDKLISKRCNLLADDLESMNENQLTKKLLSKWRNETINMEDDQ